MLKESFHSSYETLPWAECWSGDERIRLQMLMADVEGQRFAVRMQFQSGLLAPPHKHTGEVHAITLSGRWYYTEYETSPHNKMGSYLFEPPGTTHTLKIADDLDEITDVLFIIYGAMLHLDDEGSVIAVTDAESVISEYVARVGEHHAIQRDQFPIGGLMAYRTLSELDQSLSGLG